MGRRKNHPHKRIVIIRRSTFILLSLGILLIASLWLIKSLAPKPSHLYFHVADLSKLQISSTEYPYFSYTTDLAHHALHKQTMLSYKVIGPISDIPPMQHYSLIFSYSSGQQTHLYYSPILNLVYNQEGLILALSPQFKEILLDLVASYNQEVHARYGALLPWEEVDIIFPIFALAKITDIYTGASFSVQRREGSLHADVQPLTTEDTAIMKKIYNGHWSWDRKGIILETGGYRIAASMNGMPHGSGKIDDNRFPGHFCIHFLGSTTHSGNMDLRHHQEILKASGKRLVESP